MKEIVLTLNDLKEFDTLTKQQIDLEKEWLTKIYESCIQDVRDLDIQIKELSLNLRKKPRTSS